MQITLDKTTIISKRYHAHGSRHNRLPYLYEASAPHNPGMTFLLLGTQHNLPAERVPAEVLTLIDEADVLVKEVGEDIFGDAGDISLKELALHGLVFDDNACDWTAKLSPAARTYFDAFIAPSMKQAWGVPPSRISPVVVNSVVSEWAVSGPSTLGMDAFLRREFAARKKPICALEDGKVRFDACDTLFDLGEYHRTNSLDESVTALEQTILMKASPSSLPTTNRMRADFSAFFSGSLEDLFPAQGIRDLEKRNLAWVHAIEDHLRRFEGKTILFAFGFAHLAGHYGILNLLKNLGYDIKKRGEIV